MSREVLEHGLVHFDGFEVDSSRTARGQAHCEHLANLHCVREDAVPEGVDRRRGLDGFIELIVNVLEFDKHFV